MTEPERAAKATNPHLSAPVEELEKTLEHPQAKVKEPLETPESLPQWRQIWHRFKRHKIGMVGLILVSFLALVFIFSDFIAPYNYTAIHKDYPYVPPMIGQIHFTHEGRFIGPFVYGIVRQPVPDPNDPRRPLPGIWIWKEDTSKIYPIRFFVRGEPYQFLGMFPTDIHLFGTLEAHGSPGPLFLFGTNRQGYDTFSQTLIGGRVSLGLAPMAVTLSLLVGVLLGGLSGYFGGAFDTFLQRVVEIFMAIPRLALLLALSIIISNIANISPMARFWGITMLLVLVGWAPLARVIRGQFLALREAEFTHAAEALGASNLRIILRHILPNTMSYLVVSATLMIPDIIILESILSFLRFGIQWPLVSWGMLLQQVFFAGIIELEYHAWLLIPGLFIVVTVLAFNFMGDALRDAVDPFTVAEVKESMR